MKKIQKKLTLKKKTISQLSNEQLHQVQGQGTCTCFPCIRPLTDTCPSIAICLM